VTSSSTDAAGEAEVMTISFEFGLMDAIRFCGSANGGSAGSYPRAGRHPTGN
jgi:hypothetical protein